MKPENSLDTNVVNTFIEHSQNTHHEVLNRSVAKALFVLTSIYFPNKEGEELTKAFDLAYEICKQEIRKSSQKLNRLELTDSTEWLIKQCENPPNQLDLITTYLPTSKEPNSLYQDIQNEFPLKAVLTLVWTALHDHESYAHNYTNTQNDPLIQATNDLENRLQTFNNILINLEHDQLCHTGIRNQLVFSLNGIHKNVNILEDPTAAVMNILREKLIKAYFRHYEAFFENSHEQRALLVTLFRWIDEGNANPLVNALALTQTLIKELSTLFLEHGINPNSIPIGKKNYNAEEIIAETLQSLSFSCSFDQYPLLFKIHVIFQDKLSFVSEISFLNKTHAAKTMRKWLQKDFNPEINSHCDIINTFYTLSHTSNLLQQYGESLVTTGFLENTAYNSALKSLNTYFTNFVEFKDDPPRLNPDQHEQFLSLIEKIDEFKKDTLFETISNFFALYIGQKNTQTKKNLYTLLLNPDVQNKILLTDETLEKLIKPKGNSNEVEINPYILNRIILHAIITYNNAEHPWSEYFKERLKEVIDFIESNFNKKDDLMASSLRRDSYPSELLEQLKDYLNEKQPETNCFFILLPHQIKTYEDWLLVSEFLNPESIQSYEKRILPGILLRSGWESVNDKNANKVLPEFLKLIPPNQKLNFLERIPDEKCTPRVWSILHETLDENMRKAVYKFKLEKFHNALWLNHKNATLDFPYHKPIYTMPNDFRDDFIQWLKPNINTEEDWFYALIFACEIYTKDKIDELLHPNWSEIQTQLLIYTLSTPSNGLAYKRTLKIALSTINIEDRSTLVINTLEKIGTQNEYFLWRILSNCFNEIQDLENLEKIYNHYLEKPNMSIWSENTQIWKIIPVSCRAKFFLQLVINETHNQNYLETLLKLLDKYTHVESLQQFANELAKHIPDIIDLIRQEKTQFEARIAFELMKRVGPLDETNAQRWYEKFSFDHTFSIAHLAILHQTPQAVLYFNQFKLSDELAMVVQEIPDVITSLELCYDAKHSPLFTQHRNEWFEFWRLPYDRTNTVQKIDDLIKNNTWETSEQSDKLPTFSSQRIGHSE